MKSVVVYCGANSGNNPIYAEQASLLGKTLSERGTRVVFGGGSVGLMGVIADSVLAAGGQITGIITHYLKEKEQNHPEVRDMIAVETMSERRVLLLKDTDGVITMPGGYGSMDELFEALTLAQLHQYHRPIGLLNVNGFYEPLILMLDKMVEEGFLRPQNRQLVIIGNSVPELLDKMEREYVGALAHWL